MPSAGTRTTSQDGLFRWGIASALIVAGTLLTYAIELRNWRLAQVASMVGVTLIVTGVAALSRGLQSGPKVPSHLQGTKEEIRDKLLKRLVIVALFGLGVIFLYSVQYRHWTEGRVLSVASMGLISAGAAWLTGAFLGFLFGIPHTRQAQVESSSSTSGGTHEAVSQSQQGSPYEPNTSLEQISDWLTKIIVGVSLTQLNNIPIKLSELARYIALGMNSDRPNSVLTWNHYFLFRLRLPVWISVGPTLHAGTLS
jgi:MFS family permease